MLTSPKWLVLQLTEKCNLRCKMCYEWGVTGSYHKKKEITSLKMDSIRQILEDLHFNEDCLVSLFGGEPLLYPEIKEVLELIKQYKCKIHIDTNGTLLERYADVIIDSKVDSIVVSCNGPREINDAERGRGTFGKAMNGMAEIRKLQNQHQVKYPELGLNLTVTPDNYTYIKELFTLGLDLSLVDMVSIELQNFATQQEHDDYEATLKELLDIDAAPIASGLIRDVNEFKDMDYSSISTQISEVARILANNNVKLVTSPKTMTAVNIQNYFEARWDKLHDQIKMCAFPWIYLEVTAGGDVTTCHTFYDLVVGNIYENSVNEILQGDKLKKVRNYLKKSLFSNCTACCRYHMYKNYNFLKL